jgi:hypothetical protein
MTLAGLSMKSLGMHMKPSKLLSGGVVFAYELAWYMSLAELANSLIFGIAMLTVSLKALLSLKISAVSLLPTSVAVLPLKPLKSVLILKLPASATTVSTPLKLLWLLEKQRQPLKFPSKSHLLHLRYML